MMTNKEFISSKQLQIERLNKGSNDELVLVSY